MYLFLRSAMRGILTTSILRYIFKYKVTKKIKTIKYRTRKAVTLITENQHFKHDDYVMFSESMATVNHQRGH